MDVLIPAILVFVSTNVDDIFVLMMLFAQTESPTARLKITAGQFLGVGVLLAVSAASALGAGLLPEAWLRLLGLVPLGMGISQWIRHVNTRQTENDKIAAVGLWGTALLTIANGGDNLGVYIPLFTGYSAVHFAITAVVFAVMTTLWCVLGSRLADLPAVARIIRRYQPVLVPAVLVILGIMVLLGR